MSPTLVSCDYFRISLPRRERYQSCRDPAPRRSRPSLTDVLCRARRLREAEVLDHRQEQDVRSRGSSGRPVTVSRPGVSCPALQVSPTRRRAGTVATPRGPFHEIRSFLVSRRTGVELET